MSVNPYVPPTPVAPVTTTPLEAQLAAAKQAADRIIQNGQRVLQQLITCIPRDWEAVYNPPTRPQPGSPPAPAYTTEQILEAFGTGAAEIFRTAGIITAAVYAVEQGLPTPASLIDSKYLSAGKPYTANPDGTVVLNPPAPAPAP